MTFAPKTFDLHCGSGKLSTPRQPVMLLGGGGDYRSPGGVGSRGFAGCAFCYRRHAGSSGIVAVERTAGVRLSCIRPAEVKRVPAMGPGAVGRSSSSRRSPHHRESIPAFPTAPATHKPYPHFRRRQRHEFATPGGLSASTGPRSQLQLSVFCLLSAGSSGGPSKRGRVQGAPKTN